MISWTKSSRWRFVGLLGALGALGSFVGAAVATGARNDDEAGIRVVETGSSWAHEPPQGDQEDGAPALSWGIVVENPRDEIAYDTMVTVRFLDQQDRILGEAHRVPWALLPRQRVGIGSTDPAVSLDDPFVDEPPPDVARLEVEIGEPEAWEAPDEHGEITVNDLTVQYRRDNQLLVEVTATSDHDERLDDVRADLIFRDARGDIVGGSCEPLGPDGTGPVVFEPGEAVTAMIFLHVVLPDWATVEAHLVPTSEGHQTIPTPVARCLDR